MSIPTAISAPAIYTTIPVVLMGAAGDYAAIQNALNAVATAGGGAVQLSSGVACGAAGLPLPLTVGSNTTLMGAGFSTVLKLSAGFTFTATAVNGSAVLTGISAPDMAALNGPQAAGYGSNNTAWAIAQVGGSNIIATTTPPLVSTAGTTTLTLTAPVTASGTAIFLCYPFINVINVVGTTGTPVTNVCISDLQIDGNRVNSFTNTGSSDSQSNGIRITGASQVTVQRCYVHSTAFHGIFGQDTGNITNLSVLDNFLYDNGYRGCHVHGNDTVMHTDIAVIGNHVYSNGRCSGNVYNSGLFVGLNNMRSVTITGNTIYDEPGKAIELSGISTGTIGIRSVTCCNNTVRKASIGLMLYGGATDVNVSNNTFDDVCEGLYLGTPGVTRCSLSNNRLIGSTPVNLTGTIIGGTNTLTITAGSVASLYLNHPVCIAGATFGSANFTKVTGISGSTITLDQTHTGATLTGVNCCRGVLSAAVSNNGISCDPTSGNSFTDVTMSGNSVTAFGFGISVAKATNLVLTANIVSNNGPASGCSQLYVSSNSTHLNITNNKFSDLSSQTSTPPVCIGEQSVNTVNAVVFTGNNVLRHNNANGNAVQINATNVICGGNDLNTGAIYNPNAVTLIAPTANI